MPRPIFEALRALGNNGTSAISLDEGMELERRGFAFVMDRNLIPFSFVITEEGIDHLRQERLIDQVDSMIDAEKYGDL